MNFIRRIPFPFSQKMDFSTAKDIFKKSCYHKINYKINKNDNVQRAVVRFAANDISCLAVIDDDNRFIGLFSERDFIKRVASSEKESAAIQIKEVCTRVPNIVIAKATDSLDDCIRKIHMKNTRHLVLMDDLNQEIEGLISINDLFRENKNRFVFCHKLNSPTFFYVHKNEY